jgi:O-antigen biosynthesis protein
MSARPRVAGKFLFAGDTKLYVSGATYGAFRPDESGNEYQDLERIDYDFAQMRANGFNAVRIPHTMPPRALLDVAQRYGLYVMVGLSAEQYVGYLIDRHKRARDIEALVRENVRTVAGHPALLCYAIGNEIPAPLVRWLGPRKVERYLERLYRAVKSEDPEGIVTYVNYPSTEYLQLPFLDVDCINVYLEDQERFAAYLARLHNLVGDRPLLMSEIGLDSLRNGEDAQARSLNWQVRTAFEGGCAGTFIFAWTDEWHRAGNEVDDWAFGLTTRERCPKPALTAVRQAFADAPLPQCLAWPRISVVVCSYNGERTIRDCLEGLRNLEYPDFEVIVVDDGSSDRTAELVGEYDCRLISTDNRGLSSARNTGLGAASGEIVAYIDDDAYPDPQWLSYLATTFMRTSHVGIGGPNIPPPGDGFIADCVAHAPGGPDHVLLSDTEAEHIPGCNMAFRKPNLEAIGGFDSHFRTAGDDVDVCWQLRERGWTLGFSPAAMVWHHRRNSVRAYWKQQVGYGKAEALLEQKWPEKYNSAGHLTWAGQIYGNGLSRALGWGARIYHGTWGSAAFQSIYQPTPSLLRSLPLMPEWYLLLLTLGLLSALGILWSPLLMGLPFLLLATGASILQADMGGAHASFATASASRVDRLKRRGLTTLLHLLQPLARLSGRLRYGLTPWRRRKAAGFAFPRPRQVAIWKDQWQAPEERLRCIELTLSRAGARVLRGREHDRWDLEVRGGLFGAARLLMAIEDHGAGTQFVRARWWPQGRPIGVAAAALFGILSAWAALEQSWIAALILGALSAALALPAVRESAWATAVMNQAVDRALEQES